MTETNTRNEPRALTQGRTQCVRSNVVLPRFLFPTNEQHTMAIISFALTKDEFLSGQKTVTRRDWKRSHLENWQRWWDEGRRVHTAYDKIPIAGGEDIGQFRLTERPYLERLEDMPESDLEAEGGMCETLDEFQDLIDLPPTHAVAVVRFEKVEAG